jgi:hypothetical protein
MVGSQQQMIALLAMLCYLKPAIGFSHHSINHNRQAKSILYNTPDKKGAEKDMNPLTKSSWYAVELFGKVFGSETDKSQAAEEYSGPPRSLEETFNRIKLDNDRSYFLSGQVDEDIYDPNCVFSDPFVSFSGRERFVENLANLGSFITNYSVRVLDYNSDDQTVVQTRVCFQFRTITPFCRSCALMYLFPLFSVFKKIMVKLELNLPWKPILAWPWGVKYTISPETCLILDHEESWDIEAWEGVKQIFRKPRNAI